MFLTEGSCGDQVKPIVREKVGLCRAVRAFTGNREKKLLKLFLNALVQSANFEGYTKFCDVIGMSLLKGALKFAKILCVV